LFLLLEEVDLFLFYYYILDDRYDYRD